MPEAVVERIPDYTRLSYDEISAALKLRDLGKSQTEIAETLHTTQPTISRLLQSFADTRPLAKLTAHNAAQRLVERVIADADVEQSLEVLDRIEVLPKRHIDSGKGGSVSIVIGMPAQPAGERPVLDLSPSTFACVPPVETDQNAQ